MGQQPWLAVWTRIVSRLRGALQPTVGSDEEQVLCSRLLVRPESLAAVLAVSLGLFSLP